MAQLLNLGGMVVGAVGIFIGFYLLQTAPLTALAIVTGTCVGVVGIMAFLRHVVFHREDAARMGWQTDRPDWQFEVGFANLAFGLTGRCRRALASELPGVLRAAARLCALPGSGGGAPPLSIRDRGATLRGAPLAQRHRHVPVRGLDAGLRLARLAGLTSQGGRGTARVPGAAQHEVVRCRTGAIPGPRICAAPPMRCSASGERPPHVPAQAHASISTRPSSARPAAPKAERAGSRSGLK